MSTDRTSAVWLCLALASVLALAQPARAEAPLSAIDWLSQSVNTPAAPVRPAEEPAVTVGPTTEDIAVTVLDGPSLDATGLLPPAVTGLPRNLWGLGRTDEIVAHIRAERTGTLPALQSLMTTLLLAEADPPADSGGNGRLLLARVDKLLDLGALDQAAALIDAAGELNPELFRRRFDVALLTGTEDLACEEMTGNPQLAPTFPARIFCLARSGDWNAAALTLRTAQALGYVTEEEDALLSRFLDPDLYEGEASLAAPNRPSPLNWRMFEAIGEPLPTATLPLAFAQADLRSNAGWKSQIEAAERLTRSGAVSPNRLLGLYTERKPAASGGVWDRARAIQTLEAALAAGDPGEVAELLPGVWDQMVIAELEVPFAILFAEPLRQMALPGYAGSLAFRIGLLSPDYRAVAARHRPADRTEAYLAGLANGSVEGLTAPDSLGRAIAPAFTAPVPSEATQALLDDGRVGEAILTALDEIDTGLKSDLVGVTQGLSLLRRIGMEDAARRTALELMLLERRG